MKFADVRKYITGLLSASFINKEVLDNLAENESGSLTYKGELIDGGDSVTIDSELSESSINPVQNKVITEKLEEVFQSVSDGKQLVASAITDKGVLTSGDVTFEEMAVNIRSIDTNKKGVDFYITPSKPSVDIQKDFFYVEKGE